MQKTLFAFTLTNAFLLATCAPIHDHLIHCYRGNETDPLHPQTLQTFIELIRKIEDAHPTTLDIRTLSSIILHRLRVDGIEKAPNIRETEYVTPYRAKGIMSPKFQLLLQMVSDTPSSIEFDKVLTPGEICHLHRLISVSVEPWERGDESRVCPITLMDAAPRVSPKHKNHNHDNGTFTRRFSRCPIERGVIRTHDYGTFSPGTIIASIAAGLQPQNVRISDYIQLQYKKTPWDNLETMTKRDTQKELNKLLRSIDSMDNSYSAGLAGDLAEICVYQGPYLHRNTSIGMGGSWNDSHLPRIRYLRQSQHPHRWEMTDSEILAGIDGLFISQQVSSWVHHVHRMRLSQIFEMYYSIRGIPTLAIENTNNMPSFHKPNVDETPKKSSFHKMNHDSESIDPDSESNLESFNMESNAKLRAIFDHADIEWKRSTVTKTLSRFSISDGISKACNRKEILAVIDREKLKDETYFLSQVLQFSTSSMAITDDALRANCDATVDRFFNYSVILLDTLPSCNDISEKYVQPPVDAILIIDGSRSEFENLQLISYIGETTDISSYGSYLSVVHGSSGRQIVNRTQSMFDVFHQMRNSSTSNPIELTISTALKTAHASLTNQIEIDRRNGLLVGPPQVILLMSQGQVPTQVDFENARILIHGSLRRFPDLYYIFVTNHHRTFDDLMRDNREYGIRINDRQHRIITSNSVNINDFQQPLDEALSTIPKRIIPQACRKSAVELRGQSWDDVVVKNYHEEYLSPNQENQYRIHPNYFYDSEGVNVEFQGVGYGSFSVCLSRLPNFVPSTCKTVSDFETVWFNITDICRLSLGGIRPCNGIFFKVQMDSSMVKCVESECRFPDQVRFIIRHDGLHCIGNGTSSTAKLAFNTFVVALFINFLILNHQVYV